MVKDMQFEDYAVPASEGEMPTMGTVTVSEEFFNDVELAEGQEKRLNLAMMIGKEYDDELWSHLLNQLTWTEMNHLLSGGYLTVQGAPSVGNDKGRRAPRHQLKILKVEGSMQEALARTTTSAHYRLVSAIEHSLALHLVKKNLFSCHKNPVM